MPMKIPKHIFRFSKDAFIILIYVHHLKSLGLDIDSIEILQNLDSEIKSKELLRELDSIEADEAIIWLENSHRNWCQNYLMHSVRR